MIERTLILGALLGLGALLWLLLRWRTLRRARRGPRLPAVEQALRAAPAAILYFSTESCTQCRVQQVPALAQLRQELGPAVEVVAVDAARNPDLTSQFGILTVPSTVVFDRSGVRAVNLGYASAARLREQLA
jgi:hypothetical protein